MSVDLIDSFICIKLLLRSEILYSLIVTLSFRMLMSFLVCLRCMCSIIAKVCCEQVAFSYSIS